MISTEPVIYTRAEGVATITLNRPDRLNAWTREMGEGWSSSLRQAAADPEVHAVVVTGAGKGFCAGADMSLLESIGGGAAVVGEERRVLPGDQLVEGATAYARDLAANCPPGSMAVIKRQVYRHAATDLDTAVNESIKLMEESLETEDFKEGVASYLEQRAPRFRPLA